MTAQPAVCPAGSLERRFVTHLSGPVAMIMSRGANPALVPMTGKCRPAAASGGAQSVGLAGQWQCGRAAPAGPVSRPG